MRNVVKNFDGENFDLTKIVNQIKSLALNDSPKEKIIVILGATSTGKSSLAVQLAEIFSTEIISADSMSVYKNFNIGTAKPSIAEREKIRHHLIDILEPNEKFSVAEFVKLATPIVTNLNYEGKIPIIAGGTGLYIQALIEGYKFGNGVKSRENFFAATGELKYSAQVYGLTLPREILYERINQRTEKMFAAGLVDEVKQLLADGVDENAQAMLGIGYKEVVEYLHGKFSLDETISRVKQATRNFAKRQLTWYRRMNYVKWLSIA